MTNTNAPAQNAENVRLRADTVTPPEEWFVRAVRDLRKLPFNWNSYDALPITEMAIRTVCSQHLVPHADGGITVKWTRGCDEVEVIFGPDGSLRSVLWERYEPRTQFDGSGRAGQI